MTRLSKLTATRQHQIDLERQASQRTAHRYVSGSSAYAVRSVEAAIVNDDSTVEHILLAGADGERFKLIRLQLGRASITAMSISDEDGQIGVGWIDADGQAKGLRRNRIASALADRPVVGRMVITGPGRGEDDSMTSVPVGLRILLDQMAQDASR